MFVKLCGLTRVCDVAAAVHAGADAIGLNLVPSSARRVDASTARLLAQTAPAGIALVWVVAWPPPPELDRLLLDFPASRVQRADPRWGWPEWLPPSRSIDVVRLTQKRDVTLAMRSRAGLVLCDAPGALGGSGRPSDWRLAGALARRRRTLLAGGLTPDNVAAAVCAVRPYGVDVASGIEWAPGRKDAGAMTAFVQAAREAR